MDMYPMEVESVQRKEKIGSRREREREIEKTICSMS